MKTGDGFCLLFSMVSRQSFDQCTKIHRSRVRVKERTDLPVMLIANKHDLADERTVSAEEGKELAQRLKAEYMEASAKTGHNIAEICNQVVRLVDAWRKANNVGAGKERRRGCNLL